MGGTSCPMTPGMAGFGNAMRLFCDVTRGQYTELYYIYYTYNSVYEVKLRILHV